MDTVSGYGSGTVISLAGGFSLDDLRLEANATGQVSIRLGTGFDERINLGVSVSDLATSRLIGSFLIADGVNQGQSLSYQDLLSRGVGTSTLNLVGGDGDDVLVGSDLADVLNGVEGNDELSGGKGDDFLFGGSGDDTFVIGLDGGNDQIFDYTDVNTVRFLSGIEPGQIVVERVDDSTDLLLRVDANNSVLVRRGLEGMVNSYEFADGTQWSYADLINRIPSIDGQVLSGDDLDNTLEGSSAADILVGNQGNDVLRGHNGNDELLGGDGADELLGGSGNDVLNGENGTDIYRFSLGDGVDQIVDVTGASQIWFGTGIAPEGLSASRVVVAGDNFVRLTYSATDAVLIKEGVVLSGEAFHFVNGAALSLAQVYAQSLADTVNSPLYTSGDDVIWGYAGDDVLDGGGGNDTLIGGSGRDTYVMSLNGGNDKVVENSGDESIISLSQGDESALFYARAGNSLLISNVQLNTTFFIADFYDAVSSWTLKTASGVELDLRALAVAGTQGRSAEQRREDFYSALMAGSQSFDFGSGHVLSLGGSESGTDGDGNQYAYSFSLERKLIESNASDITASEDGTSSTSEGAYLGSTQRIVTYEVTDTTYTEALSVTPGRSHLMPISIGSVSILPGWSIQIAPNGEWILSEPDVVKVTLTPQTTTRTVTETITQDMYRTVTTAAGVIEDIRAGDQANAIYLEGTASKLVMAGGGNDVITRADHLVSTLVSGETPFSSDWVDGGSGDDVVLLGNGNDELSGGVGSDYLDGGSGSDRYVVMVNEDAWDTVNDSGRTVIDVRLRAGSWNSLSETLVQDLSKILLNPVRRSYGYRMEGVEEVDTMFGQVEITPAKLNELLRIDRAQRALNEVTRSGNGLEEGPAESALVSEGLDGLISKINGAPYWDYSQRSPEHDLLRPGVVFTDQNLKRHLPTMSDTVCFGDGILSSSLKVNAGQAQVDGEMRNVLLISWGGTGGIKVVLPGDGPALGQGIEAFEFADGSRMTMAQMLALVQPTNPTEDTSVTSGKAIASQEILEDGVLSFTIPADAFVVPTSASISFSARLAGSGAALPSWLIFDAATGTFSGTPGNGDVGTISVEVTAAQSETQTAKQTFTLTIVNVNDAPEMAVPIASQQATVGTTFAMTVPSDTFTDIDANDTLSYTATMADGTALPAWLTFDAVTRTFIGTPGPGEVGSVNIEVVATDIAGASSSSVFSVVVAAPDPLAGNDTLTADANNTPLHGGAGNDTLNGSWASSTLYGDSGNDVLNAAGGPSNILDGGEGDDTLTGGWGTDTLRGGDGNDIIHAPGGSSNISGGSGDDQITSAWAADIIDAGAGNDLIQPGGGGDTVRGGLGNDHIINELWGNDRYLFARGDGQDLLLDGNGQDLLMLENVQSSQLWFSKVGNDLSVSLIGTQDSITVQNWYLGSRYHVEQIKTSDGKTLLDSQVQNLVSAMASFAPPAAGQTTLPADYQASLNTVIAANWH